MKRTQKATQKNAIQKSVRNLRWLIPIMGVIAVIILAGGGFLLAAHLEEDDVFCASCHTQPEATFYQRATDAAVDLASSHKTKGSPVKCIDCHAAPGISGRIAAVSLGTRDALKWFSGTAIQPAPLTEPIGDANCLVCHAKVITSRAFNNHFHVFLARWQKIDTHAATCASCHSSHTIDGDPTIGFLREQRTVEQCQACHTAIGERG